MPSIRHALRRHVGVTVIAVASVAGWAFAPASTYAASPPEVVHEQFVTTGADLGVVNICGDLADFRFSTQGSFTVVGMADGSFHFQAVSRGTYTVTFLDSSKGVWNARIVSTRSVQATPGGTFVLSTVANTFEGPVRIHERTTFVVGADGTIRVDGSQFDFVGCPAA
jgi:hypothetical protein